MTRHSTTMQQPTEQVDTERGKDAMTRGKDDATRGDERRRRYFFFIHSHHFQGGERLCKITFNVGIDGEGPIFVFRYINTCTYIGVTDTQILCRFSYFAIVCRPRHACRVQIGNKSTRRRHVASMLPTFPAKPAGTVCILFASRDFGLVQNPSIGRCHFDHHSHVHQ